MSTVPPIRREILVDAEPAVAFEVFTAGIGQWWPVEEHSVHGKGAAVALDEGRIVERRANGGADGGAMGRPSSGAPSPAGSRPPRWRSPGTPASRPGGPAT